MWGYDVFECATYGVGVVGQNALALVIAPPMDGHVRRPYQIAIFASSNVHVEIHEFLKMGKSSKMQSRVRKKNNNNNN